MYLGYFAFMIWLALSIGGLLYFGSTDFIMALIAIGQLVFGIAMLASMEKELKIGIMHISGGIVAILIAYAFKLYPLFPYYKIKDLINIALPLVSIILGYVFWIKGRKIEFDKDYKTYYIFSWLFFLVGIIKIAITCYNFDFVVIL